MAIPAPSRILVPRAPRRAVSFTVVIEGPTTPRFTSLVRNISSSGMLIHEASTLRVHDIVHATLPNLGAIACSVARRRGATAGVRFLTPVNLNDLLD